MNLFEELNKTLSDNTIDNKARVNNFGQNIDNPQTSSKIYVFNKKVLILTIIFFYILFIPLYFIAMALSLGGTQGAIGSVILGSIMIVYFPIIIISYGGFLSLILTPLISGIFWSYVFISARRLIKNRK